MQDNRIPSTPVMILQLLGYVVAFAAPTVAAAVFLPAYAPAIVISGVILFLLTSGFILGWEWESREWTPEARRHLVRVLLIFVWVPAAAALADTIREPERLGLHLTVIAVMDLGLAVTAVPAFYLGRAIYRRKTAGT